MGGLGGVKGTHIAFLRRPEDNFGLIQPFAKSLNFMSEFSLVSTIKTAQNINLKFTILKI